MFIQWALVAIFAFTFMKKLFTSPATADRSLMASIFIDMPLNSNLSQDHAVCLFKDNSRMID